MSNMNQPDNDRDKPRYAFQEPKDFLLHLDGESTTNHNISKETDLSHYHTNKEGNPRHIVTQKTAIFTEQKIDIEDSSKEFRKDLEDNLNSIFGESRHFIYKETSKQSKLRGEIDTISSAPPPNIFRESTKSRQIQPPTTSSISEVSIPAENGPEVRTESDFVDDMAKRQLENRLYGFKTPQTEGLAQQEGENVEYLKYFLFFTPLFGAVPLVFFSDPRTQLIWFCVTLFFSLFLSMLCFAVIKLSKYIREQEAMITQLKSQINDLKTDRNSIEN